MHNNCKKLCFFLEKVLEPYPPQHAAIYKSAISSLKMIEFLWQSICDFVYLYVVWSSVLFSLCMQPFQHHIARFLFFMYPMVGGDLRKAPFTLRGRGGWGKRSCRGRNLSPNPTPHPPTPICLPSPCFLLQIPNTTLCIDWPSLKPWSQPCGPVWSTFHWRRSLPRARAGKVEGRGWGQDFFDHHWNQRDMNVYS